MTVLTRYQRLESLGLWRAGADAQRREVVVSIGDATLLLTELNGRVVTQWSLPALTRSNPGVQPALFGIEGFPGETLEIADGEMIEALEAVMAALSGTRARPGRLRMGAVAFVMVGLLLVAALWLPTAISAYVARVAPAPVRADISQIVFTEVQKLTGPACDAPAGRRALQALARRLFPAEPVRLSVLPSALGDARQLPGDLIVIGRGLVEDFETPEVVAVYLIAEQLRRNDGDSFRDFLADLGFTASVRLLTTGQVDSAAVSAWAAERLTELQADVEDDRLIAALRNRGVASVPYANARDITGETTVALIEASPEIETSPVLGDGDWLALQRICEDRG